MAACSLSCLWPGFEPASPTVSSLQGAKMLLPIIPFLARAGQSLVFLQFAVRSLRNSGGPGPGAGSSPELSRARKNWDLWGFPGKERCCQGPFPRTGPLASHFRRVMPADRAHPRSHSPPSSPISLLPGSCVLPSRPEARDKTSCLALSKEAEPLLGKSGGGGLFSTWAPLQP